MSLLPGSHKEMEPGTKVIGRIHHTDTVEASIYLRRGKNTRGADTCDLITVSKFCHDHSFDIVEADLDRRVIRVEGDADTMEYAFSTTLNHVSHPTLGIFRDRVGKLRIPDHLDGIITAVLGLSNRPVARTYFTQRTNEAKAVVSPISYNPPMVADAYNFPPGTGAGQCIGIIELGGGYQTADVQTYFSGIGVSTIPTVVSVSVDGAVNSPGSGVTSADGEVNLDIDVAGGMAPGAKIAVYFAPNTDAGFVDAISAAINDTVNKPSVLSISWGAPESSWTSAAIDTMNAVLEDAVAANITVCVASGDGGYTDGYRNTPHVDFPGSSPYVLACGGTSLHLGVAGSPISEAVWNSQGGASTGGVSSVFTRPSWQRGCEATTMTEVTGKLITMRGVPDVAANGDPNTGFNIRVDGQNYSGFGGTSAAAPQWAALIARLNANRTAPIGFINTILYEATIPASTNQHLLRDITIGNNSVSGNTAGYKATNGWDACTGLGSPNIQTIS